MTEPTNRTSPRSFLTAMTGRYRQKDQANWQAFNSVDRRTWNDTFTGVRNPGWRAQIQSVSSATTPATGFRRTVHYQAASGGASWQTIEQIPVNDPNPKRWQQEWQLDRYIIDAIGKTPPPVVEPSQSSADNQAIANLQDQLISMESSVLSGEDLGEISQTAKLLSGPMKSLRRLMVDTLEGHKHGLRQPTARRAAKVLGDATLEYRFGIKPLASTIAQAAVGLENRDYLSHFIPFRASGKSVSGASTTSSESLGNMIVDISCRRTRRIEVRYKGVWGVQTGINKRSVNDVLRLRWRDVVPTIWNLFPYSWLADYVTNIGDMADSFSVPWSGVRWCNKSVRTVDEIDWSSGGLRKPANVWQWSPKISPGSTHRVDISFSRSNQVNQPRPGLEIDLKLSPGQMVNVGALLLSRIPILGSLTKESVQRLPKLPSAFAEEVGRRGIRVPYPFH